MVHYARYEQNLQVGRLDRALVVGYLVYLYLPSTSVSSVFTVLYIFFLNLLGSTL